MDEAWFRAQYDADGDNKRRQTWEQYWGWVKAFYEGKRFPPIAGWGSREKDLLARLNHEGRAKVQGELTEVGRLIAAEWAKENAVRKVGTNELQGYGSQLEAAAKKETGDGAHILGALDHVRADVRKRTGHAA